MTIEPIGEVCESTERFNTFVSDVFEDMSPHEQMYTAWYLLSMMQRTFEETPLLATPDGNWDVEFNNTKILNPLEESVKRCLMWIELNTHLHDVME